MFVRRIAATAIVLSCLSTSAPAETRVMIFTSYNVSGSGTDSNVFLRLFDADSQSRRLRVQDLSSNSDVLEQGTVEMFVVDDAGLDTAILRVQVESDGLYAGADWHLDRIATITYPSTDAAARLSSLVVQDMLRFGQYDPVRHAMPGVQVSTFVYENWVTPESTFMADGAMQNGVMLARREPVASPSGAPEVVDTTLYVVYSADALDSRTAVERAWETTISRNRNFTITSEETQQGTFGASATVGYAAGETGGMHGEVTLSAEYQYLTTDSNEQSWGTEVSNSTNDTFTAEPGTMQFRILETRGTVARQVYDSLIQNETFVGQYILNASPFVPVGVTFASGENGDTAWNRSVARAVAVTQGEGGYNTLVDRLRRFEILSQPFTYAQAMGR